MHRASGKKLTVCATHLMTTSRDSSKTNVFPGEVRAGELARIRSIFSEHGDAEQATLLMGDFNTSASDLMVFEGSIKGIAGSDPAELIIDTGFDTNAFHWVDSKGSPLILHEAFEADHRWGEGAARTEFKTAR